MRTVVVACLLGLSAVRLSADDSTSEAYRIRAKLRSEVPADVAWGLREAVEARLVGAADLVRSVLDRAMANRADGGDSLLACAIDAIIELDIPLAPDRIREVAPKLSPAAALILAARDPRTFRQLLHPHLTTTGDDDLWNAACNLLTPIRDPVATAHLIGRLGMRAQVTVRDPGVDEHGFGGEGESITSGCGCGQVTTPTPEGWPPRSYWTLLASPGDHTRLVAPGREPIYAERREIEVGDFVCSSMPSPWMRDYDAVQYVADLLGWKRDRLQFSLWEYRYVEFTGLDAWTKELEDVRRTLLASWWRVLAACYVGGLLSPAQLLTLRPRIKFEVRDQRNVKDPELPTAPASDPAPR